jgi:hypothetical protein
MAPLAHTSVAAFQGQGPPVNPRPVANPVQIQPTDVRTLQSQLSDLRVQLTGVQAKWDGLYSQLNVMLQNNPARPRVQQEWADAGVEIARIKGEIAFREAQLALARGRPIGNAETAPAARFPFRAINTNLAIVMSSGLLLVLGLPVSIAWARRIMRRTPNPSPTSPDIAPRLEQIERAVDAIAIEVERISEGQRFVTKIFVDRPAHGGASESAASPSVKALGAGPIQPIEVPSQERQRAPQRVITPH